MADDSVIDSDKDWAQIEQAFVNARQKANGGKITPEEQRIIKDSIIQAKERLKFVPQQVAALAKLFEKRLDYADQVAKSFIEIGNKTASTEIDLQSKSKQGEIQLATLAGTTDIEIQSISAKFKAGWAGPIEFIGMIINKFAPGSGDGMVQFAQELKAGVIDERLALKRLQDQQRTVNITEEGPAASQAKLWQSALKMTDSETVGVRPEDSARVQQEMGRVAGANKDGSTPYFDPPKVAPQAQVQVPSGMVTPVSTGPSAGPNIFKMVEQLVARSTKEGGAAVLTNDEALKVIQAGRNADRIGDKSNAVDTEIEGTAVKKSSAYTGLTPEKKAFVDKQIAERSLLKYEPA